MIHLLKSLLIHAVIFGCIFRLSSSFADMKKEEQVQSITISTSVVQEAVEKPKRESAPKKAEPTPVKQTQKIKPAQFRKETVQPVSAEAEEVAVVPASISEPVADAKEMVSVPVSSWTSISKDAPVETAEPSDEEVLSSYRHANLKAVQSKIKNNLVYPMIARKNGWTGRTEVIFRLEKDGSVKNVRVAKSSGYGILDNQALEAVKISAPFTTPPRPIELTLPVTFNLL